MCTPHILIIDHLFKYAIPIGKFSFFCGIKGINQATGELELNGNAFAENSKTRR
jgi:hypothetical protein